MVKRLSERWSVAVGLHLLHILMIWLGALTFRRASLTRMERRSPERNVIHSAHWSGVRPTRRDIPLSIFAMDLCASHYKSRVRMRRCMYSPPSCRLALGRLLGPIRWGLLSIGLSPSL